jgi:hypothetical protein
MNIAPNLGDHVFYDGSSGLLVNHHCEEKIHWSWLLPGDEFVLTVEFIADNCPSLDMSIKPLKDYLEDIQPVEWLGEEDFTKLFRFLPGGKEYLAVQFPHVELKLEEDEDGDKDDDYGCDDEDSD